jgi:RNA polymerase sigma factor (TIGR02999 family)
MDNAASSLDPQPARDLFQVVYDELRRLAAHQLSKERVDHTLNPTALVHEVYLRLTSSMPNREKAWKNRGQFFMAAAEAMRRILVDHARYHRRQKRTGHMQRQNIPVDQFPSLQQNHFDLVALNDALEALSTEQADAAELVKLRYFAGMTLDESAEILGLSTATVDRRWAFAKTWLLDRLSSQDEMNNS